MNVRHLDVHKYMDFLKQCAKSKDVVQGRRLHCELSLGNHAQDTFLGNLLVEMYGKCGSVQEARNVFDKIQHPNVFSWNVIILAYARNGHMESAKAMFDKMPNPNPVSWNTIISGYFQRGHLNEAKNVFEIMPVKDVVSWNSMIAAYAQNGHYRSALRMYRRMNLEGIEPNSSTYVSTLHACANLMSLRDGQSVHSNIEEQPWINSLMLMNSIIYMYSKCGSLKEAWERFYKMPEWNVVSWNIIIAAYAQNGHLLEASKLFADMPERSSVSWNAMITLYTHVGKVEEAKKTFDDMPDKDQVSWNSLLAGFGQNEMLYEAEKLFRKMPVKNLVSWNTIISVYIHARNPWQALRHFYFMLLEGERPDQISFVNAFNACSIFRQAASVHSIFTMSGSNMVWSIASCLVVRYSQCGRMVEANSVFERLCQWDMNTCTAMIKGYASVGQFNEAKQLFDAMPDWDVVCRTTMVVAYAQEGHLEDAKRMFDEMPERDVVAWNALIGAKAERGQCKTAMEYLPLMDLEGTQPDRGTFVVLLNACTSMVSLSAGRNVHASLVHKEFEFDVNVASALIHMYGTCGSMDEAVHVFNGMDYRKAANIIVWTALLGAFCQNKLGQEAFELLKLMNLEGVKVEEIAFMSILSFCSHAGLVKLARQQFVTIFEDYHLKPIMQHYAIMIDLLARTGRVSAAKELLESMPYEPDEIARTALLSACKVHGNTDLGSEVAQEAMQLFPEESCSYSLLSVVCSHNSFLYALDVN